MTGPDLKHLREEIGAAIGRRLSTADMAKLCGLSPANGADTWRKWESGDGPSGPVAELMSIYSRAIDAVPIPGKIERSKMVADQIEIIRSHIRYLILIKLRSAPE